MYTQNRFWLFFTKCLRDVVKKTWDFDINLIGPVSFKFGLFGWDVYLKYIKYIRFIFNLQISNYICYFSLSYNLHVCHTCLRFHPCLFPISVFNWISKARLNYIAVFLCRTTWCTCLTCVLIFKSDIYFQWVFQLHFSKIELHNLPRLVHLSRGDAKNG